MARTARIKGEADSVYHVMVRSLKEFDLFQDDEDKAKYLSLLKKYHLKYGYEIYAYCLMNNHGHLLLNCLGADISKIMHSVNFSYAYYYNRKYDRYGPVFQDRFKSKLVDSERYMITVSAYIHNNPKDIIGYENDVSLYPFSSLNEYIYGTNKFEILDRSFLSSLVGFNNPINRKAYLNLVNISTDENTDIEIEFIYPESDYQAHKELLPRNTSPANVLKYVTSYFKESASNIHIKFRKKHTHIRAVTCFLLSVFCGLSQREICGIIGNITQSGVSYLTSIGHDIISSEQSILDNFIIHQ